MVFCDISPVEQDPLAAQRVQLAHALSNPMPSLFFPACFLAAVVWVLHIRIARCTSSHGRSLQEFRAGPGRGRSRRGGRKEGGIVLKAEASSTR